jgi:AICAR transformylase/IMP cyclohydrolase PurH
MNDHTLAELRGSVKGCRVQPDSTEPILEVGVACSLTMGRKSMRMIISVSNKDGLVELGREAVRLGHTIISTGGTAAALTEADVPVTLVKDITGCPEILDGRVKTIHPKIAGGILYDRTKPAHLEQIKEQGIEPIDVVIVDLYPLHRAIAAGKRSAEVLEEMDIGGILLLRMAVKEKLPVISDPHSYGEFLSYLRGLREAPMARPSETWRRETFRVLSGYDPLLAWWEEGGKAGDGTTIGDMLSLLEINPDRYPTTASFFKVLGNKLIHSRSHM